MSLIEEALRRVKDPVIPAQPTPPKAAPKTTPDDARAHAWSAAPPPTTRPSPSQPQTTNALLAAMPSTLALTALFITGAAFWMSRTLSISPETAPFPAVAPQPTAMTATPKPVSDKGQAPPAASDVPPTAMETKAPDAAPAMSDQTKKEELVLTGIVEGSGEPYAVINGSIIGVGERVNGSKLLGIRKGTAKMRQPDGTETTLSLPK